MSFIHGFRGQKMLNNNVLAHGDHQVQMFSSQFFNILMTLTLGLRCFFLRIILTIKVPIGDFFQIDNFCFISWFSPLAIYCKLENAVYILAGAAQDL